MKVYGKLQTIQKIFQECHLIMTSQIKRNTQRYFICFNKYSIIATTTQVSLSNMHLIVFDREASLTQSQERPICCCSWKTFLNSTKKVDLYYSASRYFHEIVEITAKHVHEISGIYKTCSHYLWKSLQHVHASHGIYSVFQHRVLYCIALILHLKKRNEIIQTNLLNVKRLSHLQTCLAVLE